MMRLLGTYYDGKSAKSVSVIVQFEDNTLTVAGPDISLSYRIDDIQVDPPLGRLHRTIHLPDGGQIKSEEHEQLEILFPRHNKIEKIVHSLEKKWIYAVLGLVVTALFIWVSVVYGLPFAAKQIAFHIPMKGEKLIANQTLQVLDESFFKPSKLPETRQRELRELFTQFTLDLEYSQQYHLEFRSSSIGPNAIALPDGTIVMTDSLVTLAKSNEQLLAVLAHEIGHVQGRHALRNVIQNAGVTVFISTIFGDITSITTTVIAMLPSMLVQSGYSRQFESEADDYAFAYLKQHRISPKAFAEIIELMQKNNSKEGGNGNGYFSTHPASEERIKKALENR